MRTVTNIFIVNLAVADFFVILLCLPPTVVWDVTETWFLGEVLCKVVIYFQVRNFAFASSFYRGMFDYVNHIIYGECLFTLREKSQPAARYHLPKKYALVKTAKRWRRRIAEASQVYKLNQANSRLNKQKSFRLVRTDCQPADTSRRGRLH